jgi:uncharacterized protein
MVLMMRTLETRMASTAGSRSVWVVGGLFVLALIQPMACKTPAPDDAANDFADVLADVWPEVLEPAHTAAARDAEALVVAAIAWSAAETSDTGADSARDVAREAWRNLMTSWQTVEIYQIGPGAASLTAAGGMDFRDAVYSWPTVNACRVDQETAVRGFDAADFVDTALVNVLGLDALETVLFSSDADNDCPPQVAMNDDGTWDALGEDGVRQLRADYAVFLSQQVLADIDDLVAAWGSFESDLANGAGVFGSPDEALNAVYDGLFYLELQTKDRKLAAPLGLKDCGEDDCLTLVETRLAGGSQDWVAVNLTAFRRLYLGGDGQGLDDLLRLRGHDDVADDMLAALDAADSAADALVVPIDEAAAGDDTDAVALHSAVAGVTDLLKGDLATLLFLQIPSEAAGDAD